MELIEMIDDYLIKKEDRLRDENKFHVSELGKGTKYLFEKFKNISKKNKPTPQLKRIFENGNFVHFRYYKYFMEMGILRSIEIKAVDNEIFSGTADCIISGKDGVPWVVDIKSCNSWVFKKLEEIKYEYKIQILFYMYYLKINQGIVLYENKDTQEIKIFKIFMDETNKNIVENLIIEFEKLKKDLDNNVMVIFDDEIVKENKPNLDEIQLEDLDYGIS